MTPSDLLVALALLVPLLVIVGLGFFSEWRRLQRSRRVISGERLRIYGLHFGLTPLPGESDAAFRKRLERRIQGRP